MGVVAVAFAAFALWTIPEAASLDDSYIALASARTLVRGSDPHFGSPALTGATSPPYVALLAALLYAGTSPLGALRAAAALSAAAFAGALCALARAGGLRWFTAVSFTIVVLASGQTWMVTTNGLETGMALAALTGTVAATLANRTNLVAAGTGLLPCLRPDLAPAAAALFLWNLRTGDARTRGRVVVLAGLVGALFIVWLRLDTGYWMPQTMYAKGAFFAQSCLPIAEKMSLVRWTLGFWLLAVVPASLGLLLVWRIGLGAAGLLAAGTTLLCYTWFFPGGLAQNSLRYLFPILLPWAALGWVVALRRWPREGSIAIAAIAIVALLRLPPQHASQQFIADELRNVSSWMEENLPRDATVLVHDAGAVSVLTTLRLVDVVGLKTPSSIGMHRALTVPSCGARRGEAVVEIARRQQADYLVVIGGWERPFALAGALSRAGMVKKVVRRPPESWPNGYTIYELQSASSRVE